MVLKIITKIEAKESERRSIWMPIREEDRCRRRHRLRECVLSAIAKGPSLNVETTTSSGRDRLDDASRTTSSFQLTVLTG